MRDNRQQQEKRLLHRHPTNTPPSHPPRPRGFWSIFQTLIWWPQDFLSPCRLTCASVLPPAAASITRFGWNLRQLIGPEQGNSNSLKKKKDFLCILYLAFDPTNVVINQNGYYHSSQVRNKVLEEENVYKHTIHIISLDPDPLFLDPFGWENTCTMYCTVYI